jgi:PHP family Zn ribbon phosphoesterase
MKMRKNNKHIFNLILNIHNENIAQIINAFRETSLKIYLGAELRGGQRGRVFQKGKLREILESEGKEVTEEWRKFHIGEL